jgi:hypothetical protein
VFAAPRVSLQAKSRAGLHFKPFHLEARLFFEDFIATPWPFVKLSH